MQPIFGQRIMSLCGARPPRQLAEQRGQTQRRTRRLALEVCEPRWLLAALPWSAPLFDTPLADPSPAAEVFDPGRTAPADPASDSMQAPTADPDQVQNNPDADPSEIADEADVSESSDWNSLGARPQAMSLSAALEGSTSASSEETSSDQPFSVQNQPDEPAGSEATRRGRMDGLSAVVPPSMAASGLEAERRAWTTAAIARYPLYDAARAKPGEESVCPAPARAPSLVFLDVGRAATPAATGLRLGSADWTPIDLAGTSGRAENSETDFATDFDSPPRVAQKPSALSPSRVQPPLAGENRGQRMMLLASAGRRLRGRADAFPPPVSNESPEPPQVQPQGRHQDGQGDGLETLKTSRAGTAVPDGFESANRPAADERTSRSAIEGIVVLMLLAADWFAQTHIRSRQEPQERPHPGVLDSRQVAARDKFFERLFAWNGQAWNA